MLLHCWSLVVFGVVVVVVVVVVCHSTCPGARKWDIEAAEGLATNYVNLVRSHPITIASHHDRIPSNPIPSHPIPSHPIPSHPILFLLAILPSPRSISYTATACNTAQSQAIPSLPPTTTAAGPRPTAQSARTRVRARSTDRVS